LLKIDFSKGARTFEHGEHRPACKHVSLEASISEMGGSSPSNFSSSPLVSGDYSHEAVHAIAE
jgi:hypothetical protein